jgi:hypothetical protein
MLAKIPFDKKTGNLVRFFHRYDNEKWHNWKPNEPFEAVMMIENYYRGSTATGLTLISEDGKKWPMFMSKAVEMLKKTTVKEGKVRGVWVVGRRGAHYGLNLVEAKE